MSTAIVPLATQEWDAATIKAIKETVCKGATESQFVMFMQVCRSTGLNPFLKEIYYAPQIGVMASRDGYLRKANDNPQFDGMETRVERDDRNIPIKAVCTVWRKDRQHPVICEAYYNEYKKSSDVWNKYPSAMIAKVAEVLALKRSFAINGVMTEEEIGEQGSKEAQQEYLRSKGIGIDAATVGSRPMVSGTDGVEARAASESVTLSVKSPSTSPEVIRELSEILDAPSPGLKSIELRHAKQVAEADAEVGKPTKRKRGGVSFDALKGLREIKQMLLEVTGTTEEYYAVLKANGYQHSDEIETTEKAREIWKALMLVHNQAREDKKLRAELALAESQYGDRFWNILGYEGCQNIDDVLCLSSEPLERLRKAIKELPPLP